MAFRSFVFAGFAVAATAGITQAQVAPGVGSIVALDVPEAATVGVPVRIACAATDPDGISRLSVQLTEPDGAATVLAAAFGAASQDVTWTPVRAGEHLVRCRAKGMSASGLEEDATKGFIVLAPPAADPLPPPEDVPVVEPEPVVVAPGVVPEPEAPPIGACVYQDGVRATLSAPRRVAATPEGDLFVTDAIGRLFRLTRRGDLVASILENVVSVAAGPEVVFAALRDGTIVSLHPQTGRVLGNIDLRVSEAPVGLAFDAANDRLWIAFGGGAVQVRRSSGELVRTIVETPAGPLVRVVDVAVGGGMAWVTQQDQGEDGGLIHGYDEVTGDFVRTLGGVAAGQVRVVGSVTAAWDRVYAADLFAGRVWVFDATTGALVDQLGRYGSAAGELARPAGVARMANGDLVVTNMDADRLDRFGAGAELPVCDGDTDCDYLSDAWELANGLDPNDPTNAISDVDGDGLNATEELAYGTNPRSMDTDGDGAWDLEEILAGMNPNDARDNRVTLAVDVPSLVDPGFVQLAASMTGIIHDPCSVEWRQVMGPLVAVDASSFTPSFIARRGAYRFEAVATCGPAITARAVVDVTVRNLPPRPDAGLRLATVEPGARVQMHAGLSSDANGDELAFAWDQLVGAPLIDAKAGGALSTRPMAPGFYVFRLGASDPRGAQGIQEIPVVVVGDAPTPTAVVVSPVVAREGDVVVLDATGSYRGSSARFVWDQVAGPWISLEAAVDTASFTVPGPGRYAFEVYVVDGDVRSPPARIEVFAAAVDGALPVASATAEGVVRVGVAVDVDGSASYAPSGAGLTYAWRQVAGPAAGVTLADRAVAKFVAFKAGSYELELVVEEGAAVSVPARVRLEARQDGVALPVAVASAVPTASVGEIVVLDDSGSTAGLHRRWTQVEGPWVAVSKVGETSMFVPRAPGVYGFELEVDDGDVRSAPARVNVMVFANGMEN